MNYEEAFTYLRKYKATEYGEQIQRIIRELTEEQAIECASLLKENNITNEYIVYIIVNACLNELSTDRILMSKDTKKEYQHLLDTKQDRTDIKETMELYGLKPADKKYYKSKFKDYNLPRQGWIINIAAENYDDYRKVVLTLIPELSKLEVAFKVLVPEYYQNRMMNVIKIYMNHNFNILKLSDKALNLILENINTQRDKYILGRLSATFENYFSNRIVDTTGELIELLPGNIPTFLMNVTPLDILNFHEKMLEKANEKKDIAVYIQEYMTGYECPKKKMYYHSYVIDDKDLEKIKNIPALAQNKDLNTVCDYIEYKNNTEEYHRVVVVYEDFNKEVLTEMIKNDIPYIKLEPIITEEISNDTQNSQNSQKKKKQ